MKHLFDDLNKQQWHEAILDEGSACLLTSRAPDANMTLHCASDLSRKHRLQKQLANDLKLRYFWQMTWQDARHFERALLQARSWL